MNVHQVKYHTCSHCDYKTIQNISLQYHIKITHQDITFINCIECKPNRKIESKEMFECFDCEQCCCQSCKDGKKNLNKWKVPSNTQSVVTCSSSSSWGKEGAWIVSNLDGAESASSQLCESIRETQDRYEGRNR